MMLHQNIAINEEVSSIVPVQPDPAMMTLREQINEAFLDAGVLEYKIHDGIKYIGLADNFRAAGVDIRIRENVRDAGLSIAIRTPYEEIYNKIKLSFEDPFLEENKVLIHHERSLVPNF